MNKLLFLTILISYSFISQAQISLDKNLRTTLKKDSTFYWNTHMKGKEFFQPSELDLDRADSLLIQVVNHYNRRINYGTLTNQEFKILKETDSLLSIEWQYYKLNGKEKKGLKKLRNEDKEKVESIHSMKDSLSSIQELLTQKRFNRNDSIIKSFSGWSTDGNILLTEYFRQYIPFINENGQKVFYVNCFCHNDKLTNDYWKNELAGGGDLYKCLFNVLINIETSACSEFMTN